MNRLMRAGIACALLFAAFASAARAEIKTGVASRNVTPNPLLGPSGGSFPEPPIGKKGELEIRAVYIDDGSTKLAIVSVPYLGFPAALCDKIRSRVRQIPAKNILIGSTHTHGAPDPYGFPNEKGERGIDMKYLEEACRKGAEALIEALTKAEAATFKIAEGEAKGKIAYNYYAPDLYDPRCNVIQAIAKDDGEPLWTLVNYAIHPEVLISTGIVTPDVIGPLHDRIAEKGGGMGVFMNGAQGGMITADCRGPDGKDIATWEECIRIGNLLGDEALRIVAEAPVQENPSLFCGSTEITFPLPENEMLWKPLADGPVGWKINPDRSVNATINLVNFGSAQILTIPGEALPNIGYFLKRKMRGEQNMLFGLTNDAFGYILTQVDWNSFRKYEYVTRTGLGEMTGEIYIEKALAFVEQCPKPEAKK